MFPAYGFADGRFGVYASSERDAGWLDAAASVLQDINYGFHLLLDEPAALGVRGVVEEARASAEADREVERSLVLAETTGGLVPGASSLSGCGTITKDFDNRRGLLQAGDACAATQVDIETIVEFGHLGLEAGSSTE
jgi:hypothetical protein